MIDRAIKSVNTTHVHVCIQLHEIFIQWYILSLYVIVGFGVPVGIMALVKSSYWSFTFPVKARDLVQRNTLLDIHCAKPMQNKRFGSLLEGGSSKALG